jgi:hypothetical protein
VIAAVHEPIHPDDAPATRAFLRDVLRWPSAHEPDAVPPWPIFRTGPKGADDMLLYEPRHPTADDLPDG